MQSYSVYFASGFFHVTLCLYDSSVLLREVANFSFSLLKRIHSNCVNIPKCIHYTINGY